ncbi:hypothetical protein BH20ACI3_BH20ACI3_40920 [soil metagenome]
MRINGTRMEAPSRDPIKNDGAAARVLAGLPEIVPSLNHVHPLVAIMEDSAHHADECF